MTLVQIFHCQWMYDFSEDSVLLCLASEHYKPDEYIRNYEDFLRAVQEEPEA